MRATMPSGQQIRRRKRRVGLQRHLTLGLAIVGRDGAHARAAYRHAAAAKRDTGRLAAVAVQRAIGVVAAFGTDELGDLGVHQLGQHFQADGGRGEQQALAHVRGERRQVAVDASGQPLGQPVFDG
jgi:hypothetical protein